MREGRGGRCSSRGEFNEREVRLTNSLITEPCHSDWARALTLSEHRKVMLRAEDYRIGLLNGNRICFLTVLLPNKQNTLLKKKEFLIPDLLMFLSLNSSTKFTEANFGLLFHLYRICRPLVGSSGSQAHALKRIYCC